MLQLLILLTSATSGILAQSDSSSGPDAAAGGYRTGTCTNTLQPDGAYSVQCNFGSPEDGVITRHDILWLAATVGGGAGGQRLEIQLPKYVLRQAITGAVSGSAVDFKNDVVVRVPAPDHQVETYGQGGDIQIQSVPRVQFEYEPGTVQPVVHYSAARGNLKPAIGVLAPDQMQVQVRRSRSGPVPESFIDPQNSAFHFVSRRHSAPPPQPEYAANYGQTPLEVQVAAEPVVQEISEKPYKCQPVSDEFAKEYVAYLNDHTRLARILSTGIQQLQQQPEDLELEPSSAPPTRETAPPDSTTLEPEVTNTTYEEQDADADADPTTKIIPREFEETTTEPPPEVTVTGQDEEQVKFQEPSPDVKNQNQEPEVNYHEPTPEVNYQEQPIHEVNYQEQEPKVKYQEPTPELKYQEPAPELKYQEPAPEVKYQEPTPEVKYQIPTPEVEVEYQEPTPEVKYQIPTPEVKYQASRTHEFKTDDSGRAILTPEEQQIINTNLASFLRQLQLLGGDQVMIRVLPPPPPSAAEEDASYAN